MVRELRCVIDASQPCHAGSAPSPDQCPHLYLLGWSAAPDGAAAETNAPAPRPDNSAR